MITLCFLLKLTRLRIGRLRNEGEGKGKKSVRFFLLLFNFSYLCGQRLIQANLE